MSLVKKDVFWTFETELKYLNRFKPSPVCWLLFTGIKRLHNTPWLSPIIRSTLLVYILLLGPSWCWLVSRGLKVTTQTSAGLASRGPFTYYVICTFWFSFEFMDPGMTRLHGAWGSDWIMNNSLSDPERPKIIRSRDIEYIIETRENKMMKIFVNSPEHNQSAKTGRQPEYSSTSFLQNETPR